jgi:iron complex outermembrane receptor protein
MVGTTHVWVSALALCTAVAVARGDEASGELERLSIEELMNVHVHSASLTPEPVETAPSVVSVITAEQIRTLGLRTLADAVQLMPGVTVLPTQSGGMKLVVRGRSNVNDVLVTLDGERLNDFYDGSFLPEFPLENVERIELIRGPGSALYGTNAFAGVISIFSRNRLEAFGGIGAEATFDHSAGIGVRAFAKVAHRFRERWTLQVFGSYRETTGPKVLVARDGADPRYSLVPAETNAPMRLAVAQLVVRRQSLLVRDDELELWSTFIYRRRMGSYFGPADEFAPDSDFERQWFFLRLSYEAPLKHGLRVAHRFSFDRRAQNNLIQDEPPGFYNEVDGNFTREPGEVFPNGQLTAFSFTTYRVSQQSQLEWKLPRPMGIIGNDLIAGAMLEYDWLPSFQYGQNFCCGAAFTYAGPTLQNWDQLPLTQLHKDRLIAATYLHDQLQPWRWLWLTVGLRLDWYSDFGTTWNPRAAAVIRAHKKLSFKLLYGRAFRAPSFRDLYDQTGVSETAGGLNILGNHELRPETVNTFEVGFETSPWKLLTLRGNAYYIRTADVIDVDATFTITGARLVNYPGLQIFGGEAEAQLHFDGHNYLSGNLSYFASMETGPGLPGYQTDAERRYIDPWLHDLPRLRLNLTGATTPLARLHVPAALRELQLGAAYHYIAGLGNNSRFTFEALAVFQQPAFHELILNVVQPLPRAHIELFLTLQLAFGRTIAVPLTAGWYDLPTSSTNLFIGLRAHD